MLEFLESNLDVSNAIIAISSVVIAFFAFVTSTLSLIVSVKALVGQRKHNILTVQPIPEISVADYENSLRVKLRNNGNGPMFISSFQVAGKNGEAKKSIISCMKTLPEGRAWTHFTSDLEGRVVMPGHFLPLLELTASDNEAKFSVSRDLCRNWLKDLSCELRYTDMYKSNFPHYTKSLKWFGRNI